MIYRSATPADGSEMLRLIEYHPSNGDMNILYTRRPDAYKSYLLECPDAKMILCVNNDNRVLAQCICLPRKLYINREVRMVGYVTGLHKEDNALVNILKLLETGYVQSSVRLFFVQSLT